MIISKQYPDYINSYVVFEYSHNIQNEFTLFQRSSRHNFFVCIILQKLHILYYKKELKIIFSAVVSYIKLLSYHFSKN